MSRHAVRNGKEARAGEQAQARCAGLNGVGVHNCGRCRPAMAFEKHCTEGSLEWWPVGVTQ